MTVTDSGFLLTATARDFERYFPTYLANGCFSSASSLRGTDAVLTLVAGLMDRTSGDVSRPAAIPSWVEIDYHDGAGWLNETPVTAAAFRDYAQTLDMYDGILSTQYTWGAGSRLTDVAITTLIGQPDFHLAATSLALTPQFSGSVRLRLPLRAWPPPAQRLPLAQLTWRELKDALAQGNGTRAMPVPAPQPQPPSREILTWLDLQDALAAEGRVLNLPPTAATRASIWYPGEVRIRSAEADPAEMVLSVEGDAINGAEFTEALAIELPTDLAVRRSRVMESGPGRTGVTIEIEAEVQAGRTYRVTKYVSVSRTGWGDGVAKDLGRSRAARAGGFTPLVQAHAAAWHRLWEADIVIENLPALQRVIHSDLFYLLQNSNARESWPIGACGITPNYFGHVFWDCDNWVFPILLLMHPDRARHLVTFRHRTLAWARANAARRGLAGAMFPWEADPETGTEETPHYARVNAEREIHLSADIALAQWQYFLATGDLSWLREHGHPVIEAAADFYVSRVAYDRARDRYELLNVTSVDEKYTNVNNDAYTNAMAGKSLAVAARAAEALGKTPDPRWAEIAAKLHVPFSEREQRHLMFDESVVHDRTTWMAGALAFLCAPHLDLHMPDDVRRNNYKYAFRRVAELSPEPNQMMLAMLSVQSAALGDPAGAERWLHPQEHEFLKPPFNMRSETPHNNCTHHLAAACGFLQALMFGFTGLRITEQGLVSAYAPVLPAGWAGLTLKGVRFRGRVLDFALDRDRDGNVRLRRHSAA